jgi:ribosomal protein S9
LGENAKSGGVAADTQDAMSEPKPIRMVVRRGAVRRFEALKKQTAELPVVVTWDRRQRDRRNVSGDIARDRRRTERRHQPSFTWELADFVVVDESKTDSRDE